MSPTGIQVNKTIIIVIAGLFIGVVVVYRFWLKPPAEEKPSEVKIAADTGAATWFKKELVDVPKELVSGSHSEVTDETVEVTLDGKSLKIFTRQSKPNKATSNLAVLFLHGLAFTSQDWVKIGSLAFIADSGYRAVAVDLPGFGNSKEAKVNDSSKGLFIAALVKALQLNRPVLVSPSMSGIFSLPFLFTEPGTAEERSRGYVPVAPTKTGSYKDVYKNSQIPTMIVYGEKDTGLGEESIQNLKNLPNSKMFKIKGAGHPAYLDDTAYFNKLMYNFLKNLAPSK